MSPTIGAPTGIRPLPAVNRCPHCNGYPRPVRAYLRGAYRAECACGVAGPYANDPQWPHHAALEAWRDVFGGPPRPRPPEGGSGVVPPPEFSP
jgi:hypothetical protein